MATFKGTWLGKYSLHGSYNYLYIYTISFSQQPRLTLFHAPSRRWLKSGRRRGTRLRRRGGTVDVGKPLFFLGRGGGGWGKTRGKQWDNPPPSSGTSTVSHQDLALCI